MSYDQQKCRRSLQVAVDDGREEAWALASTVIGKPSFYKGWTLSVHLEVLIVFQSSLGGVRWVGAN